MGGQVVDAAARLYLKQGKHTRGAGRAQWLPHVRVGRLVGQATAAEAGQHDRRSRDGHADEHGPHGWMGGTHRRTHNAPRCRNHGLVSVSAYGTLLEPQLLGGWTCTAVVPRWGAHPEHGDG